MVIGSKRYFPYPVLWLDEKDNYKHGSFHCDIEIESHVKGLNLQIRYKFHLSNRGLLEHIANRNIVYSVHLECPATGYREIVPTQENEGSLLIEESRINGEFQVCTFLLANKEIEGFTNTDFVEELQDFRFQIDKGCILGIGESYIFYIDTRKSDLRNVPSVLSFIKNEDPEARAMEVLYQNNRIGIKLPAETFSQYKHISSQPTSFLRILHSMFIVPALTSVILDLKRLSSEDRIIQFSSYRWYRAISKAFVRHGYEELDSKNFEEVDVLKAVQEVLDLPQYYGLQKLSDHLMGKLEEDME